MNLIYIAGENMGSFSNLIFLFILSLLFLFFKIKFAGEGLSFSSDIMETSYEKRTKESRTIEYTVIILSILNLFMTAGLSIFLFIFLEWHIIFIIKILPLIIYLLVNKKYKRIKGIAFLILSLWLLLI